MVIEVTWQDSCAEQAYFSKHAIEHKRPLIRHNVGYEVARTDECIVMSSGVIDNLFDAEQGYDGYICIPLTMVVKESKLQAKEL